MVEISIAKFDVKKLMGASLYNLYLIHVHPIMVCANQLHYDLFHL